MSNKIPKGTTSIDVYYNECYNFDFKELGIDIEQVDTWYVKYNKLHITYKNGTQEEYDNTNEYDVDYSNPDSIEYNSYHFQ